MSRNRVGGSYKRLIIEPLRTAVRPDLIHKSNHIPYSGFSSECPRRGAGSGSQMSSWQATDEMVLFILNEHRRAPA